MTREAERLALFSIAAALPESGSAPPEWITVFPTLGDVRTRDGRSFVVDGADLVKAFEASGIDIPIDVNHSTDNAAPRGERSDAVGWISRLRVEAGALQGKVEWLDEGRALLARRAYRYVSPSFAHKPDGRATWLKAVSLVNVPALADQSALAAASGRAALASVPGSVLYDALSTPLPSSNPPPDWVVVFPALGFVETRNGLIFYIDGKAILEDFDTATKATDEDFRQFPVDIDHRSDRAVERGEDPASDPIGVIRELRIEAGRLDARVDWTSDGAKIVKEKKYFATSPTLFCETSGKVQRIKSLSLVSRANPLAKSRALGNDISREEAGSLAAAAPPGGAAGALSSFEASVHLGRRISETAKSMVEEHRAAGLRLDMADALTRAASSLALSSGGAEGLSSPSAAARENEARRSETPAQTGKKIADMASKLVAQARDAGATLSLLDAIPRAAAQLGVASHGSSEPHEGAAAEPSTHSAGDIVLRANKLVAEYSAAGQTLSFLQAVEQLTAEASRAGSSREALLSARNAGECTVHEVNDVVRRANSLIAEHKAAGLSLSFVEAVERSTKS